METEPFDEAELLALPASPPRLPSHRLKRLNTSSPPHTASGPQSPPLPSPSAQLQSCCPSVQENLAAAHTRDAAADRCLPEQGSSSSARLNSRWVSRYFDTTRL